MGGSSLLSPPSCSWADAMASMGGVRVLGPGRGSWGLLTLLDARQPWAECSGCSQSLSSATSPGPQAERGPGSPGFGIQN